MVFKIHVFCKHPLGPELTEVMVVFTSVPQAFNGRALRITSEVMVVFTSVPQAFNGRALRITSAFP
jgi:hypothetical protein